MGYQYLFIKNRTKSKGNFTNNKRYLRFYWVNWKDSETGTFLGVAVIKSLYTNVSHDLRLKALEYWTEQLQHKIEYL